MTAPRYAVPELVEFARALLARVGLRDDIARDVATVLVDGDLMGHTTHGLALLAAYLGELDKGAMAKDGAPVVTERRAATQMWDAGRLPGPWVTLRAFDAATEMAKAAGTGTVVVRRSHHIAALAAYLPRVTACRQHGAALLLRPEREERRALWRRHVGVHAESVRGRHSDVGRSDPARHLGQLHDQWPHQPLARSR
jgi:L-lactate dehydrogenase